MLASAEEQERFEGQQAARIAVLAVDAYGAATESDKKRWRSLCQIAAGEENKPEPVTPEEAARYFGITPAEAREHMSRGWKPQIEST